MFWASFDYSRFETAIKFKFVILTNLNSGLGQVDFKCYFFTHKYIWISSFAEQLLENIKLGSSERRSLSSLLSRVNAWKIWSKEIFIKCEILFLTVENLLKFMIV